jgi:hypothetical protein
MVFIKGQSGARLRAGVHLFPQDLAIYAISEAH